jgi:hypothetical protein
MFIIMINKRSSGIKPLDLDLDVRLIPRKVKKGKELDFFAPRSQEIQVARETIFQIVMNLN